MDLNNKGFVVPCHRCVNTYPAFEEWLDYAEKDEELTKIYKRYLDDRIHKKMEKEISDGDMS